MKTKLAFYWLIVFFIMMTPTCIFSHVKDKNDMFTACGEDMIFLAKGEILVFHQYLYNKYYYFLLMIPQFIQKEPQQISIRFDNQAYKLGLRWDLKSP